jgi:hypothetical protein
LLSKNKKIKIYRSIILPVLYGCETWFFHIEGEHRLGVFGNRVLRELLGFMRDNAAGECGRITK